MPDFGIMRGFNEKLFGDKLVAGQLPTQLGLIGSQEVNDFDADALAFFQRVSDATGTLSLTEKQAVNQLVLDLKANSLWTPMKAIYPMVGASAAACAQNLKSASFTGSFTSGWTFASTGVKGNGTSAYMDTNFNPNTSSNANSKHMSYYSRDNFNNCQIGLFAASIIDQIFYVAGGYYNVLSTASFTAIITATTKGLAIASRTSAVGGCTTYVNNSNLGNDGRTASANPNGNLWLNARATSASGTASANECAFASIGDGLTDTEASNFYTAVQAFQTTLSRNV
jgi:hypothetical protein